MNFTKVGRVEEIGPGQCRTVRVGVRRIVVFNLDGTFHALEDACRHMKAPLSTGRLSGSTLTCSWHGWKYDVRTGACTDRAWGRVRTFPVKVEEGIVMVSDEPIPVDGEDPEGEEPEEIPSPVFRS